MRRTSVTLIAAALLLAGAGLSAEVPGGARLKDIAALQGPSATSVIGYGLVVGLNKTGDR
jgi:flagellar P-ring protein precursor FlgI